MGFSTTRSPTARKHHALMRSITVTQIDAAAYARPLHSTDALRVRLEGPAGESWTSVGGGATVGDALAFAVASAPADTLWRIVGWSSVYGD
jgi:hypothetical protein